MPEEAAIPYKYLPAHPLKQIFRLPVSTTVWWHKPMPAVSGKLSVSLPEPLARFVEAYWRRHGMKSKSEGDARNPDAWLDSDLEETLEDGAAPR